MSLLLDAGDGLFLRQVDEADAPALFSAVDTHRDHLRRWLPWVDASRAEADSLAFIRGAASRWSERQVPTLALWWSGRLVGMIGEEDFNPHAYSTQIGYWLAADATGRGLMTRAVVRLIDHAFGLQRLRRVEIRAATGNLASRAVPERLGFRLEGVLRHADWLRGVPLDHAVYGLLEAEWPDARAAHLRSFSPARAPGAPEDVHG